MAVLEYPASRRRAARLARDWHQPRFYPFAGRNWAMASPRCSGTRSSSRSGRTVKVRLSRGFARPASKQEPLAPPRAATPLRVARGPAAIGSGDGGLGTVREVADGGADQLGIVGHGDMSHAPQEA